MQPNQPSPESQVVTSTTKGDSAPVVFISYSWDSDEHASWVVDLASDLTRHGIKILLDRWDLHLGDDKTFFMESAISKSDFVLIVCTTKYAEKANQRQGGVGYEAMIITGQLAAHIDSRKFIPALRSGSWDADMPVWLATRMGVDLRANPYSPKELEALVDHVSGVHLHAPQLGGPPQKLHRPAEARAFGPVMTRRIQELQDVTLLRRNMRMTYILTRTPVDSLFFMLEVHLEWDMLNLSDKAIEYAPFFAEEEYEQARALYVAIHPRKPSFTSRTRTWRERTVRIALCLTTL